MNQKDIQASILDALREVEDPEVGINIVDLGLIYGIEVEEGRAIVEMTMTTPACPLFSALESRIREAIQGKIPEIREVEVRLVWEPPWGPERMSPEARRQLGWEE